MVRLSISPGLRKILDTEHGIQRRGNSKKTSLFSLSSPFYVTYLSCALTLTCAPSSARCVLIVPIVMVRRTRVSLPPLLSLMHALFRLSVSGASMMRQTTFCSRISYRLFGGLGASNWSLLPSPRERGSSRDLGTVAGVFDLSMLVDTGRQ